MPTSRNRRKTLKGLAAFGLSSALVTGPLGCVPRGRDAQVIVVGAGLSGLTAALMLQDQGVDVLVVEGSNRIGGRVFTFDDHPHKPEVGGAEFSVLSYARVLSMINRLGLSAVPWRGKDLEFAVHVRGRTVDIAEWPTAEINHVQGAARGVPPAFLGGALMPRPLPLATHDAWLQPSAGELDVPFGDYLSQAGADKEALRLIASRSNTADLNGISALWKLHEAKFAEVSGSLDNMRSLEGGMSRLPEGMAALLSRPVRKNAPVEAIETSSDGVEVCLRNGDILRGDYAVCSVPLTLLRRMRITPGLPEKRTRAVAQIPYGDHVEVFFDVLEPFWEMDGLPSSLWTDGPLGVLLHITNNSPYGYLWVAIMGPAGAHLSRLSEQEVLVAISEELAKVRPSTVGRVRPIFAHNWSTHEWTRGHLAYRAPGQIREFGNSAAEPHGRIHFAGEHTAVLNVGLEGAMESGERAAVEILGHIG